MYYSELVKKACVLMFEAHNAEGVAYMDYVKALAENPIARKVKLADLKHNLDSRRLSGQKPAKNDTYLQAIAYLARME